MILSNYYVPKLIINIMMLLCAFNILLLYMIINMCYLYGCNIYVCECIGLRNIVIMMYMYLTMLYPINDFD